MYFAERGRPTAECAYHARWAFAGGLLRVLRDPWFRLVGATD